MVATLEDFVTAHEAVAVAQSQGLKINIRTLEYWRYSGQGPNFTRVNRTILYSRRLLSEWIEKHLLPESQA